MSLVVNKVDKVSESCNRSMKSRLQDNSMQNLFNTELRKISYFLKIYQGLEEQNWQVYDCNIKKEVH